MRYSTRIIIFLALSVTSVTSSPMSVNLNALATQAVSISPRNTANDKRGLVYDYLSADYAKMFVGSKSSFGSNWHGTRDETGPTLPTSFNFIPTLTVDKNLKNDQWIDTTQSIINGGAKFVFASNEPDHPQQANLTPSQAAQVYQKYMMPLKGLGASIATPAVTNGGAPMGLTYLESFVSHCSGCSFDVINIHHYVQRSDCNVDQAVAAFKTYLDETLVTVQNKYTQLSGLPVCIGEFWLWDASDEEGAEYLKQILPYLDAHPRVVCYQAFGGLWKGRFINDAGNGLTQSGLVYRDY